MKISSKLDYACKAVVELSLHWPNTTPLQINTIAQRQNVPVKFLTHILINLKQLGFVNSIRGKNGGYLLAKKPEELRLSDLVGGMGGVGFIGTPYIGKRKNHVLDIIWQEVNAAVLEKLDEITFEVIADRIRSQSKILMFDI